VSSEELGREVGAAGKAATLSSSDSRGSSIAGSSIFQEVLLSVSPQERVWLVADVFSVKTGLRVITGLAY
jgi:hypothetical protein